MARHHVPQQLEHGSVLQLPVDASSTAPFGQINALRLVSEEFEPANLRVSVTGDQDGVYKDEVMTLSGDGPMKPTLLLISKRLGHDNVNPLYYRSLKVNFPSETSSDFKALLELPQSIGIAGGRPSSSHYFVASQGDNLFYLDPHYPRPSLPFHSELESYTSAELATCHTRRLRRIHLSEMDPSMLIAFLVKDRDDWLDWLARMDEVFLLSSQVLTSNLD
jgi:cysteine protease ATG4